MVFLEVGVGQQRGDIVVALCEVVGAAAFRKRGVHLYFQFAAYDAGGKRACRLHSLLHDALLRDSTYLKLALAVHDASEVGRKRVVAVLHSLQAGIVEVELHHVHVAVVGFHGEGVGGIPCIAHRQHGVAVGSVDGVQLALLATAEVRELQVAGAVGIEGHRTIPTCGHLVL